MYFLAARVGQHHVVQRFDEPFERVQMREKRVQGRLQVRHHHRRTYALAFHVRHHSQHRVRRELDEIVIVAARFERHPVRDRDIESGKLRRRLPAAAPFECCAPGPDRVPCAACAPFRGAAAHFRARAPRDRKSPAACFHPRAKTARSFCSGAAELRSFRRLYFESAGTSSDLVR